MFFPEKNSFLFMRIKNKTSNPIRICTTDKVFFNDSFFNVLDKKKPVAVNRMLATIMYNIISIIDLGNKAGGPNPDYM